MVVKYLNATMTNLVKVSRVRGKKAFIDLPFPKGCCAVVIFICPLQSGFPSKNDSPACEYTRVDFDSDEDFNAFFHCKQTAY